MIKQYLVAVTYPDHYTPLTAEQLQYAIRAGFPILPQKDISVEEDKPVSAPPMAKVVGSNTQIALEALSVGAAVDRDVMFEPNEKWVRRVFPLIQKLRYAMYLDKLTTHPVSARGPAEDTPARIARMDDTQVTAELDRITGIASMGPKLRECMVLWHENDAPIDATLTHCEGEKINGGVWIRMREVGPG